MTKAIALDANNDLDPLGAILDNTSGFDRWEKLAVISAELLVVRRGSPQYRDAVDLLTALLAIFLHQVETGEAERYAGYDYHGKKPTLGMFEHWLEMKYTLATDSDTDREAFYKQMAMVAQGDLEDEKVANILLRCQNNTPDACHRIYLTMRDAVDVHLLQSRGYMNDGVFGDDDLIGGADAPYDATDGDTQRQADMQRLRPWQIATGAAALLIIAVSVAAAIAISSSNPSHTTRNSNLELDFLASPERSGPASLGDRPPSELLLPPATVAVDPGQPVVQQPKSTDKPRLLIPASPTALSSYEIALGADTPVQLVVPDDARVMISAPAEGERCLTVVYAKPISASISPSFRLCRRVN